MTSTDTTRNTIDKAIERLRGNWRQDDYGGWGTGSQPVCAMGAIYWATENLVWADRQAAVNAMDLIAFEEHDCGVEVFNDKPSTTEEDVILLMKKASARLDEMEAGR